MERRIARLQTIYRRAGQHARQELPHPDWDATRLTSEEMVEFADLLAPVEAHQRRTGEGPPRCYTATLSAAQLDRLEALWSRVIGIA